MRVREAMPADAEAVRAVHHASITELGPAAYTDEQVAAWAGGRESTDYAARIEDADYYIVAERSGAVVGFGSLEFDPGEEYEVPADAEVTAVYVHPSVTRKGVGSAILDDLEREASENGARTLGLWSSLNAVAFYESHGYGKVRDLVHEFSAPSGAEGTVVEMVKEV